MGTRLKPCPSFDGLFPRALRVGERLMSVQIGQLSKARLMGREYHCGRVPPRHKLVAVGVGVAPER